MPRPSIGPTALLEDQAGGVWVGTAYSGLYHVSGTNSEKIPIAHEEVLSLAEDFEGSVWVGTTGDGLYQIRPRVVDLERTEEGLPFEAVQSLCEDTSGVIWAATQNGALARRFGERWQFFSPGESWAGQASCVAAGPDGIVWIGTRMAGFFCWQHDRLVNWGNADDLVGRTIHTLQTTRTGDLWIGEDSPNALQRLRAGKLTTLSVPSENMRVIRAMTEDAEDAIWAGTSRGVLLRVKDGEITDKTVRSGDEPPPSIRCLYTSPDGAVWVGYASGYGLGRIRNGHVARIRSDQGLFDDGISHIIADDRGWLWFGSDRGIFKARQRELDDVADGRAERVRSIHYGRGEGLPSLQANFGGAPGALRSRDGRIWIPMRAALAIIYPNRLRENLTPPPVLVHRVSVDEQTAALYSGAVPTSDRRNQQIIDLRATNAVLRLAPSHRRLEFEFTALSFAAPENVHFRYELENFDDDWTEGNNVDRSASYSRLPAGHYKFRVVACNSDGVWNQAGAVLDIVVRPFAWQTWWFQTGTVLAFTGLVIAAVRYVSFRRLRLQLRRLEEQEALHKERARIAKDIHDDVGANLTQIALLGDLARQDGESGGASASRMDTISTTARQAVKSLDEIVWAVNPRNDTLAHLIDYTGQFAVDYLRPVGIRCRLDLPDQTPSREISTDVRHNLFLVVKEALNNVVKHAKATEVWLRVAVSDAGLQVCVEDNGRGFDEPPQREDADGLRNMRQRCRDIGGDCRIESHSGGGTKVRVDLPWPVSKT
jgi:signal transduction histidine kinase/streptogramin lyase